MKLYYAAAESALKELDEIGVKNILISLANGQAQIPRTRKMDVNLLLDSGAFTFQNAGGIMPSTWCYYVNNLERFADEIISLDVIGDAEKTYENYVYIKQKLKTDKPLIPTFHVGSDLKYLDLYLKDTDRIAIGGMVPYKSQVKKLQDLLWEIFRRFESKSMPKFHAFGYFSQQILEMFPFYSADASTWQNYSRWGEFHIFKDWQYQRVHSPRVSEIDMDLADFDHLEVFIHDQPDKRLKLIHEAITQFEIYLTMLWQKKGIKWT